MLEQSAVVTVWECLTISSDCWRPLLRNSQYFKNLLKLKLNVKSIYTVRVSIN